MPSGRWSTLGGNMQGRHSHARLGGNAVWWNVLGMKWVRPHTHTHVLYAYWHVCTHSGTQRSVHTQAHTHTQSLLVCVHTLRYTQVCTHTSARTHMHIHKQTQTHTHTPGAGLLAWVRYTHVCILGTLAHTGKGMHALTQEVTCVHTQASHLAVMPGHA